MDILCSFLDLLDQKLNDKNFIRKHVFSSADHSRNRNLNFQNTWWAMLNHSGCSLQTEVPLFSARFPNHIPSVSPQAFSKARNKIKYTASKEIFELSSQMFAAKQKLYKGYRLAAVDASRISTPETAENRAMWGVSKNHFAERSSAMISLLFNPMTDIIMDAEIAHSNSSERDLLINMLDRMNLKDTILLLDRGYPGKEIYRYLNSKNLKYIIRMGIGSNNPRYIREAQDDDQIATDIYKNPDITQRIVRISLDNGNEELLVSNLTDSEFKIEDFKTLYHLRWPVETKFDELKNKLNLEKFTGYKTNIVCHDFYISLIKSNITAFLRLLALENEKKNEKKINIQSSIKLCAFYLPQLVSSKSSRKECIMIICNKLKRMLIPIRKGRSFERIKKTYKPKYRLNLK